MSLSLVQTATIQHGTSTTASASFSANTTSGNLLVAVLAYGSGTTPASGPSGWTQAVNETDGQNGIVIYFLAGASSITSGTSLTCSLGYSGKWVLSLSEWSAVATTGALSQTVTSSSTGTTGSITEGGAALFVGGVVDFDGTRTYTAGSGTTILAQVSEGTNSHTSCNLAALYAIKTSGSTTALTVTNGSQTGCMASFLPETSVTIPITGIASTMTLGTIALAPSPDQYCPCNTFSMDLGGPALTLTGSFGESSNAIGGVGMTLTGSFYATSPSSFYPVSSAWLLDEVATGSPGEYLDFVGGSDGTGGGTIPDPITGIFCRGAQDLDGRSYITFPGDTIRPDQAITVTLWAQIETNNLPRTWFSRGVDDWQFQFGHTQNNQALVQVQYVADDLVSLATLRCQSYTTLERNRWYLFAATFEPGNTLSVYVDGVLARTVDATNVATAIDLVGGQFAALWNGAQMPQGSIQDLRIYPYALSTDYLLAMRANYCDSGFYSVGTETTV